MCRLPMMPLPPLPLQIPIPLSCRHQTRTRVEAAALAARGDGTTVPPSPSSRPSTTGRSSIDETDDVLVVDAFFAPVRDADAMMEHDAGDSKLAHSSTRKHRNRRATARAAIVDALKEVPKPFAGALFDEASRVATYAKPAANRPAHISPKDVITLMNFVRVILRPDEGTSDRATDRAEAFERVCLPEFNSDGFMYVYASTVSTTPSASPASTPTTTPSKKNKRKSCGGPFERDDTVGVCFVVASADALDACRRARDALECSLNEKDALSKIARAAREGLLLDKLPSEVLGEFQASVKQLLHVVYNRPERHQHVSTAFNASVKDADVEAITRAYASTLDAMKETEGIVDHTVSPSFEGSKQRVRYERRSRFNVLACVGGDFEIYLILKPTVTTRAAIGLCNRLCVWLRVSEPELFVDVRA